MTKNKVYDNLYIELNNKSFSNLTHAHLQNKLCVLLVTVLSVFLLSFFSIVSGISGILYVNAADIDDSIYSVLTRSNLRAEPASNGTWISTVPGGALVIKTGELENGYIEIVYGEFKGYIYAGCIQKAEGRSYEDYCKQFPQLDVDRINKSFGVGITNAAEEDKYMPYEQMKNIYEKDEVLTIERPEAKKEEIAKPEENITNPNKDEILKPEEDIVSPKKEEIVKQEHNVVSTEDKRPGVSEGVSNLADNIVKTPENAVVSTGDKNAAKDIHTPDYIDIAKREDKNITGPDAKIYNETSDDPLDNITGITGANMFPVQSSGDSKPKEQISAAVYITANMRSLPTSESKKLTTIPAGEKVLVIDDGENGFVHIKYNNLDGYAFARCLDYEVGTAYAGDKITSKTEEVATTNTANSVLASRRILSKSAVESLVNSEDEDEDEDEAEDVKVVVTSAANSNKEVSAGVSKKISARVNMRALPSSDSTKVISLPIGANIEVLGQASGGYSLVQYNGVSGYVLDNWIVDAQKIEIAKVGNDAIMFECTAYCSCARCCGKYSPEVTGRVAHTATGTIPAEGRTIAVDPRVIPYGTKVVIDGMGTYVAEDCGGGVKGNHIDIYFDTHDAAVAFGRRRLYVSIAK